MFQGKMIHIVDIGLKYKKCVFIYGFESDITEKISP